MWGKSIYDKEGADVAKEVHKVFSSKPCSSDTSSKINDGTLASSMCLKWTEERYESLTPGLCEACKKVSFKMKVEEGGDHHMEIEEHLDTKEETDFDSYCQGETDMEHFMEGNLSEGEREKDVKEEDVSKVPSFELHDEDLKKKGGTRYKCKKKRYKCDFCDEVFHNKVDRLKHVKGDHKVQDDAANIEVETVQYNCPICHEPFGSDRHGCWGHLKSFHKEKSEVCEVQSCRYACVGKELMLLHTLAKHKKHGNGLQVTLTCDICGKPISQAKLPKHYREEHNLLLDDGCRFICRHCGEAFKSKGVRADHINQTHLKVSFDCKECGKSFKRNKRQLYQHMKKVHMKESCKKQCHICKEWYKGAEELATHVRRAHTGEKPFPCVFCHESFYSSLDANKHRKYKHGNSYNADQKRKAWIRENPTKDPLEYKMNCHLCSKVISTISALRRHWDEVHPGETDNKRNQYTRTPEQKIICELCGKVLQSKHLLKIHTFNMHEPEATKCPICQEEFPSRDGAIVHMKEHVKKYPSQTGTAVCEHCGFVGTKLGIKSHMRIHDKSYNRPTICTYCEKEFTKYENMTRHRRIAHREQWNLDKDRLMVEEGSKNVGKSDYLKKFVKKSTCATCGVTLCSRTQLHLHMKARHGAGLPDYGLFRGRKPREIPLIANEVVINVTP